MNTHTIIQILLATTALGLAGAALADDGQDQRAGWSRTVELPNGNTADIDGRLRSDGHGNAAARRNVTVTDADDNVVYEGQRAARRTDDGKKARAQRGTWTDADGNTVEAGRRAATDGDGNVIRQRGKRVTDADGNVIAKGKDTGVNRADGRQARSQKRMRVDQDGNVIRKKRQARRSSP